MDKEALADKDLMEDTIINGERCYGQLLIIYGERRSIQDFFVGSQTLTVYDFDYQGQGTIYEYQDFEWGAF